MAKGMTFWGNRYDPSMSGFRVGFAIWVHYNNKYVELLDTAWMLLRKKDRQVCYIACTAAVNTKRAAPVIPITNWLPTRF